ncbi:uncharacterized protein K02A2.6-like [Sitophilus oryzae]|uniref:RNA-directed DNA polymerase n=1 Tax=Sitophilus oryzae TaxID=7048 RepID=A0A6J2XJM1_SITOR|nr:uncharacterized protein K02A2.6-like [Sitophilus oryzae]
MWGYRLIIPKKSQLNILKELHSSHMGIVKMKSLARSYVWWPNMDKDIELYVNSCKSCCIHAPNPTKNSISCWNWPKEPWTRLHADFFHMLNKNFLVIQDATSKWLECFEVNNITATTTIKVFRELFARFGLPIEVCTDNGPTFISEQFQLFLKSAGIRHLSGAPYNPETNGLEDGKRKVQSK